MCCGLFINHVDIWDLGLTNTVFSLLLVFWDFFFLVAMFSIYLYCLDN